MSLLHDEQFIIFISLLLFLLLVGKKLYLFIVASLDQQINQITDNLDTSKKKLLASSTKLHIKKEELETFIYTKDNLIYKVQNNVESYYEKTIEQLNKKMRNQQISLQNYLDNTYQTKIDETHKDIINTILIVTKHIIHEEITYDMHKKYIDKAIIEIKDILTNE